MVRRATGLRTDAHGRRGALPAGRPGRRDQGAHGRARRCACRSRAGSWKSSARPASGSRGSWRSCAARRGRRSAHRDRRGVHGSTPYAAWRELLRAALEGRLGGHRRRRPRAARCERRTGSAPELRPWLPLLAVPFDLDAAEHPRSRCPRSRVPPRAAAQDRRGLPASALLDEPTLIECDDAQYLDEASAELFGAIAREVQTTPWLVVLLRREAGPHQDRRHPEACGSRRTAGGGRTRALAEAATDLAPLNPHAAGPRGRTLRRQPAIPRDLLRAAAEGDGDALPESLEAAAMARIDRLDPRTGRSSAARRCSG